MSDLVDLMFSDGDWETLEKEINNPPHILDRLAELAGLDPYDDELPSQFWRIYDEAEQPVRCRLCDRDDHWLPENSMVFVCDHGTCCGLIRQLDSVPAAKISRAELVTNA